MEAQRNTTLARNSRALASLGVNHANASGFSSFGIEDETVNDAEGSQGHASGFFCGGERRIHAIEVGAGDASTFAGTAVVAGGTPFVSLGENGGAADCEHALAAKMFGRFIADELLRAIQFHRRKKLAVGQLRQSERFAGNSSEFLDIVVPGSKVGVADGPVNSNSVAEIGFEVEVAPAIALASPRNGTAADLASTNPAGRACRDRWCRDVLYR